MTGGLLGPPAGEGPGGGGGASGGNGGSTGLGIGCLGLVLAAQVGRSCTSAGIVEPCVQSVSLPYLGTSSSHAVLAPEAHNWNNKRGGGTDAAHVVERPAAVQMITSSDCMLAPTAAGHLCHAVPAQCAHQCEDRGAAVQRSHGRHLVSICSILRLSKADPAVIIWKRCKRSAPACTSPKKCRHRHSCCCRCCCCTLPPMPPWLSRPEASMLVTCCKFPFA